MALRSRQREKIITEFRRSSKIMIWKHRKHARNGSEINQSISVGSQDNSWYTERNKGTPLMDLFIINSSHTKHLQSTRMEKVAVAGHLLSTITRKVDQFFQRKHTKACCSVSTGRQTKKCVTRVRTEN